MEQTILNKAVHVNPESFEKIISGSDVPVLVDFWAPWCAPCRMLGPVLDEVASENSGKVLVAKVNVDDYPELAQKYRVQGIPTVKVFSKGSLVDEAVGAYPKQHWENLIEKHS